MADIRKLKDSIAELLRKQKYDKVVELLEELVRAEPKDMAHRLKLGDAYRRLGIEEKAIASYRQAAKTFGDDGQLIKAIGALKVILEMEPKNALAQRELVELNNRRFGTPTLESAGLRVSQGIGAGARATSVMELVEGQKAADAIASLFEPSQPDGGSGLDEESLELDEGDHSQPTPEKDDGHSATPPSRPPRMGVGADRRAPERRGPPPQVRPAFDLGGEPAEGAMADGLDAPAARAKADPTDELTIDLDPELDLSALAAPGLSDAVAPGLSGAAGPELADAEVLPDDVLENLEDAHPAGVEAAPPRPAPPAQPIADLLVAQVEEEIELLSVSTNDELPPRSTPPISASSEDLDEAFGAIGPPPASAATPLPPKKLPPKVPLFGDLSDAAFVEFVNQVSYRRVAPGDVIVHEGDPGRSFFVIVEGKVRVYKKLADGQELQLAELGAGAFFGEMALLSGAARTANVAATEDTELLEVTDAVLRDVVGKHPTFVTPLKNFYRQRLLNNVMTISPLFRDFDPNERRAIVERFRMKQGTPGEVFVTEGASSDGLYVVLHGCVGVTKKGEDGKPVELAKLKEGELFGEMSLLTRSPASATVTAVGPCLVLKLPRELWQELMLTHPQILELVSDLTEKRRSATEATLSGMGAGHDGMSFV